MLVRLLAISSICLLLTVYHRGVNRIGIVIPTKFEREEYLLECINSIRDAGEAFIMLVVPQNPIMERRFLDLVDNIMIEEPGGNLASKINAALWQLPISCQFVTWLGDDDLLTANSLDRSLNAFRNHPEIGLVYGSCGYIDAKGHKIGQNPSGTWAQHLMSFGPFLIPQPGSLWRRRAFESIGGLDDSFHLAFDHDLFLRLRKHSRAMFINKTQAQFRWHADSLSVSRRWQSVMEASRARRKHYKNYMLPVMLPWELIVIMATKLAGDFVSWRTLKN